MTTEKKPNMLIGLDSIQRKPQDEENLNTLFYKMFNNGIVICIGLIHRYISYN
mgnify:CR=1 FL=1